MPAIHTLHFGCNYEGSSSALNGCHNDAKDLYGLCYGKTQSTVRIIGNKMDKNGMIKAFRKSRYRLQNPGDLLFVSLSSHGTNENGYQGVVTADFNVIWDYEMDAAIEDRAPGTFLIFLLDCCHSDGLKDGKKKEKSSIFELLFGSGVKAIPIERCSDYQTPSGKHKSRDKTDCGFIAGCKTKGYSYDAYFENRANGALTYFTLRAWRELEKGSTYLDLFNKVGGRGGYLPTKDCPQQPTKFGTAENFARVMPFKK